MKLDRQEIFGSPAFFALWTKIDDRGTRWGKRQPHAKTAKSAKDCSWLRRILFFAFFALSILLCVLCGFAWKDDPSYKSHRNRREKKAASRKDAEFAKDDRDELFGTVPGAFAWEYAYLTPSCKDRNETAMNR